MREGEGWPAVLWKENTEKQVVVPGWDSLEYTIGEGNGTEGWESPEVPEEGDSWNTALWMGCVCMCVWVCGCVDGRAQCGRSKVRLEDTSDEAHPPMVAMGLLSDSTVLWASLHLSSPLVEPCCCQACRCCHKNTSVGDDNHVPSCSQSPLSPGAGKPEVQALRKRERVSPPICTSLDLKTTLKPVVSIANRGT